MRNLGSGTSAAAAPARLSAALLVQAARLIAGMLRSASVATAGGVTWSTGAPRDNGADLYGGALGIAVFLAAYARADGSNWARELALEAARPALRAAWAADAHADDVALGGLVGRGAQIYGLVTLARLLDEPALFADAHRLATRISPRWIAADRALDVVHGTAGLILALLSLGPAASEPGPGGQAPLAHVRAASARLVAMQRPDGAQWAGAVIDGANTQPHSGFAHGATGIAVALAKAGRALGDDALLAAAARALAFERAHFIVAPGRWRAALGDRRTPIGWCRGAPGVALGRSLVLDASAGQIAEADADAARREITDALDYLQDLSALPLDHLCCGGMSVVDALVALSPADGSGALMPAAHARALWILRAARARGHFVTGSEEPTEPSLLQGLAGIGYGFLRLSDPAAFPCVAIMA